MRIRLLLATTLVSSALIAGGCGGSDEDGATSGSPPDDAGTTAEGTATEDGAASATGGTGTLTLDDGTSYTFEMTSCSTSDSDPDTFLVDPGFDLFGESEDGFRLTLIRAGLDEKSASLTGGFEGEFDENGVNAEVSYNAAGDEDGSLEVDGPSVTGTVTMSSLGSNSPFGESIEATVEVTC